MIYPYEIPYEMLKYHGVLKKVNHGIPCIAIENIL